MKHQNNKQLPTGLVTSKQNSDLKKMFNVSMALGTRSFSTCEPTTWKGKIIQAIVGHKEAGVTAGRYGGSQQLVDTVAEAIELIDYTRDDFVSTYD